MTKLDEKSENSRKAERVAALRAGARLAATQAIYQWQAAGDRPEGIIREFAEHRIGRTIDNVPLPPANLALFSELVLGVTAHAAELDDIISGALANDWTFERMEATLRAILRCGAYELAHRLDIPAKATIAEYVAVADAFFGSKETGLVNGVLDRLARALRPEEMEKDLGSRQAPR